MRTLSRALAVSGISLVLAGAALAQTCAPPHHFSADDQGWGGRRSRSRRAPAYRTFHNRPTAAIGGMVEAWQPADAPATDALLRGYVRGYVNPFAAIQGEVGYWAHTTRSRYPEDANTKLSDIPVGVSLLYFFRPGVRAGASLYGGLGVAWHNWTWDEDRGGVRPLDHSPYRDQQTAFGYHYIAGMEIGSWRGGGLFDEYRYTVGRMVSLGGLPFEFTGSSVGGGINVAF